MNCSTQGRCRICSKDEGFTPFLNASKDNGLKHALYSGCETLQFVVKQQDTFHEIPVVHCLNWLSETLQWNGSEAGAVTYQDCPSTPRLSWHVHICLQWASSQTVTVSWNFHSYLKSVVKLCQQLLGAASWASFDDYSLNSLWKLLVKGCVFECSCHVWNAWK